MLVVWILKINKVLPFIHHYLLYDKNEETADKKNGFISLLTCTISLHEVGHKDTLL